jgi:hypothetical protein
VHLWRILDGAMTLDDIFTDPLLAFAGDVERAERDMDATSDSYSRRSYTGALFAMIEGTVYLLKQIALKQGLSAPGKLSIAEIALLQEEAFELTDKAEPMTKPRFIKIAYNIRFARMRQSWRDVSAIGSMNSLWIGSHSS